MQGMIAFNDIGARNRYVTHSWFLFFPSVSRSNSRTAWIRNTEFKYSFYIKSKYLCKFVKVRFTETCKTDLYFTYFFPSVIYD